MKSTKKLNWLIAIVLFFGSTTPLFSQPLKDVFSNSESALVYLGIDFSKARLLDAGNAEDIRNRMYGSINQLIVNEPKKYDLKGALRKSNIDYDFDAVTKSNATANLDELLSTSSADFNRFKESDVLSIVKNLDLKAKSGVGLLFVMEAMRKTDNKPGAAIWVTFVDLTTQKVLLTERLEVKGSGGIGFRNYWASTIRSLIEKIDKAKYKLWQNKYSS